MSIFQSNYGNLIRIKHDKKPTGECLRDDNHVNTMDSNHISFTDPGWYPVLVVVDS